MIIIDATDLILGRLASSAAKKALEGESVVIVNSEKAVVTGKKETVLSKYVRKRNMGGPLYGPFFPRVEDRFLKRTIRGMLPYKQEKGISAFRRVKCFVGIPEKYQGKKMETIESANVTKTHNLKYMTLKDICRFLGKND